MACTSSAAAIGEAYRSIRDGYLGCVVAGGAEARQAQTLSVPEVREIQGAVSDGAGAQRDSSTLTPPACSACTICATDCACSSRFWRTRALVSMSLSERWWTTTTVSANSLPLALFTRARRRSGGRSLSSAGI